MRKPGRRVLLLLHDNDDDDDDDEDDDDVLCFDDSAAERLSSSSLLLPLGSPSLGSTSSDMSAPAHPTPKASSVSQWAVQLY
jgi:hypothetical protein